MALILLCGGPSTGKTTVALKLKSLLTSQNHQVMHITDLNKPPSILYKDSTTEKQTRAHLRTTTERALSPTKIILCDSLNYIKGFRYELFCLAKTNTLRFILIHLTTPSQTAALWDTNREHSYSQPLLSELTSRFEPPQSRNRFERPLFPLDPSIPLWQQNLIPITTALLSTPTLSATRATLPHPSTAPDLASILDTETRTATEHLLTAIRTGAGQGALVPLAGGNLRLTCVPTARKLRDIRAAYLSLARTDPPSGRDAAQKEFLTFLAAQL